MILVNAPTTKIKLPNKKKLISLLKDKRADSIRFCFSFSQQTAVVIKIKGLRNGVRTIKTGVLVFNK